MSLPKNLGSIRVLPTKTSQGSAGGLLHWGLKSLRSHKVEPESP
jgi:hypothetical protein